MHVELLQALSCPQTGKELRLQVGCEKDGRVESGDLISEGNGVHYPIRNFIPRFVPEDNYASNFGMQWNMFRRTQLDSYSGFPISADRFWRATGWSPEELKGRWILDVGCGAGRFAEIALNAGANVIALDYSNAVQACYDNLSQFPNLHVVQGDIYRLPFRSRFFPFIYSLGVLQHTPDVSAAFSALPRLLCPGGQIAVDVYEKSLRAMLHPKYLLRPVTKHISKVELFSILQRTVPGMLILSCWADSVPLLGPILKRLIPVSNYTNVLPLHPKQLEEWALLDTFDALAPEYDQPQTEPTLRRWLEDAGLINIAVDRVGHLVGRGVLPS